MQQWQGRRDELNAEQTLREVLAERSPSSRTRDLAGGSGPMRMLRKQMMLNVLDDLERTTWGTMDYLRHGHPPARLRAEATRNGNTSAGRFTLFSELLLEIKRDTIRVLPTRGCARGSGRKKPRSPPPRAEARPRGIRIPACRGVHTHDGLPRPGAAEGDLAVAAWCAASRIGRNRPCPRAGPGKKYKHCHGQVG